MSSMGIVPSGSAVEVKLKTKDPNKQWVAGVVEEFDSNTGEYIVTLAASGVKVRVALSELREVPQ